MMDLVLRLREARRLAGFSQKTAARRSGVGEKTISSFETGERIGSLKVEQLSALLVVYGLTLEAFFSIEFERRVASAVIAREEQSGLDRLLSAISGVDDERRGRLVQSCVRMAELSARQAHRRGYRIA